MGETGGFGVEDAVGARQGHAEEERGEAGVQEKGEDAGKARDHGARNKDLPLPGGSGRSGSRGKGLHIGSGRMAGE